MDLKRFIVIEGDTLLFSANTEEGCRQFVKHPENYRTQYANGIIEVGATPFIIDTWREGIELYLTDSEGNNYYIYTQYGVFEGASKDAKRVNIDFYIKEIFDTLLAAKILFNAQKGTQSGWVNKYYECQLAYENVCEISSTDGDASYSEKDTLFYDVIDSFTEDLEWHGANAYCSEEKSYVIKQYDQYGSLVEVFDGYTSIEMAKADIEWFNKVDGEKPAAEYRYEIDEEK